MESAFAIATRMAFLDQGKIIFEGTPDEFKACDQPIIREFLESYLAHEQNPPKSPHANPQK